MLSFPMPVQCLPDACLLVCAKKNRWRAQGLRSELRSAKRTVDVVLVLWDLIEATQLERPVGILLCCCVMLWKAYGELRVDLLLFQRLAELKVQSWPYVGYGRIINFPSIPVRGIQMRWCC
jgi:hypothetical protein